MSRHLEDITPDSCIFASSTSSISINELAESFSRKDNFGGMHFFNPVETMKLVEITPSEYTSEETVKVGVIFKSRFYHSVC